MDKVDTVDLDAYYAPYVVSSDGQIYWFSHVTNEVVMIQRVVGHG